MPTDLFADALPITWLLLLGGWVAADATSFGQFMVSRPFVAATMAGWLAGDPVAGASVGLVLEVFHLAVLPVGAARYPEGGPPAVVAGSLYAVSAQRPSTLLMVVAFALAAEWLTSASVRGVRHVNVLLVASPEGRRADRVERRHLAAVACDFLRGVGLVLVGMVVLSLLLRSLQPLWSLGEEVPRVALNIALAGLLGSSIRLFAGRSRLFVAGAVGGLLLALLRP